MGTFCRQNGSGVGIVGGASSIQDSWVFVCPSSARRTGGSSSSEIAGGVRVTAGRPTLLLLLTVEVVLGRLWQAASSCADLFLWHQKNKTWHSPLLLEPTVLDEEKTNPSQRRMHMERYIGLDVHSASCR